MASVSVFISHSSQDRASAQRLAAELRDRDFHSFFLDVDPERGIGVGRDWEKELYRNLISCGVVLFLGSPSSVASKWCFVELALARALGRDVLPVKIAACDLPDILRGRQAVDLVAEPEAAYANLWAELGRLGVFADVGVPWDSTRAPYPGISAFAEADAGVFCGREQEAHELVALLRRMHLSGTRLVLVTGASGSGKSSVVRAGLLPALRRNTPEWIVLDPANAGSGLIEQLAEQLTRRLGQGAPGVDYDTTYRAVLEAASGPGPLDGGALSSLLRRLRLTASGSEAEIVWVVDQAERLLIDSRSMDLRLVANCSSSRGIPLQILLTIRTDQADALLDSSLMVGVESATYRLRPLPVARFGEVIERPARLAGLELAPGLVSAMVADASRRDGLPLMAFALRELWDRFGRRQGGLTVDDYVGGIGGMEGAVARKASEVMARLTPADDTLLLLRQTLCRMARLGDNDAYVSRRVSWDSIPEAVRPIIQTLVDERLLVSAADGPHVEVVHETLFRVWDQLHTWLDEERRFFFWKRLLDVQVQQWEERGRNIDNVRLAGASLAEAREYLSSHPMALSVAESEFIEASLEWKRREDERWRREYQISLVQRLAAQAQVTLSFEGAELTTRGLLLAIESMRRCVELGISSLEADQALREGLALTARRIFTVWPEDRVNPQAVCVGPRDGIVVFGDAAGRIAVLRHPGLERPSGVLTLASAVEVVQFSPDGQMVAVGSRNGECVLLDTERWESRRLDTPEAGTPVTAICFSADSRNLAAAAGTRATVWDLHAADAPVSVEDPAADSTDLPIVSMTFAANADVLVTQQVRGDTIYWRWRDQAVLGRIQVMGDQVCRSSDGRFLGVTSVGYYTAVLADLSTGAVHQLATNAAKLVFSPDGRFAATASPEHFARIWQLPERVVVQDLRHNAEVWDVAFSPDSTQLVTQAKNGVAHVWNATSGVETARLVHGPAIAPRFLPDNRSVLTYNEDGALTLWDTQELREVRLFRHPVAVLGIAFADDGRLLATAARTSPGSTAPVLIDVKNGRQVTAPQQKGDEQISPTAYAEQVLQDHRVRACGQETRSPDGRLIATVDDTTVRVCESGDEGHELCSLQHPRRVMAVVFSPDSGHLVTASDHDTGRIWNARTGQEVSRLTHSNPHVTDVDFSPDGSRVATASWDGTARIWLWRPEDLMHEASSRAARNLTEAEWNQYLPSEPYRTTLQLPEDRDRPLPAR